MGKGQSKSYDISKYTIIQFLQLGSASLFFFNDVRFVSDIWKKKAICPNVHVSTCTSFFTLEIVGLLQCHWTNSYFVLVFSTPLKNIICHLQHNCCYLALLNSGYGKPVFLIDWLIYGD